MNNDISNSDLLEAMQQRNLVYNYNFLNYSNQTDGNPREWGHPDGWIYIDNESGGQISFDENLKCCKIVTGGTEATDVSLIQFISEFPRWEETLRSKKVSAIAKVGNSGDGPSMVSFWISDGINSQHVNQKLNSGEIKELTLSFEVDSDAFFLKIYLTSNSPGVVIDIYKVYANIGKKALESLPCMVEGFIGERKQYMSTEIPPATEISLCVESYELPNTRTRLSSFLNGKFGLGVDGLSMTPDMRGYFSRAWDNGAKVDPDANERKALGDGTVDQDHVGTVEEDEFLEHVHDLKYKYISSGQFQTGETPSLIFSSAPSATEKEGGNETRAKNIAELYTMKWA